MLHSVMPLACFAARYRLHCLKSPIPRRTRCLVLDRRTLVVAAEVSSTARYRLPPANPSPLAFSPSRCPRQDRRILLGRFVRLVPSVHSNSDPRHNGVGSSSPRSARPLQSELALSVSLDCLSVTCLLQEHLVNCSSSSPSSLLTRNSYLCHPASYLFPPSLSPLYLPLARCLRRRAPSLKSWRNPQSHPQICSGSRRHESLLLIVTLCQNDTPAGGTFLRRPTLLRWKSLPIGYDTLPGRQALTSWTKPMRRFT